MLPFRSLLKYKISFVWTKQLDDLFEQSKAVIVDEIKKGVEIFNKSRPTCLVTDWCKDGVGFWLMQKHCECTSAKPFCCKTGWKITLVGSRFTSGAESRYWPIEGEALAVVDALDKARHFVLGCSDLMIAVDHRPLVKVLGGRCLNDIANPRLRNLKEKCLRYRFKVEHLPGIRNAAADSLSRHPVSEPNMLELPDDVDSGAIFTAICTFDPETAEICSYSTDSTKEIIKNVTWNDIRLATASDPSMRFLIDKIQEGFPDRPADIHTEIRPFHQYRDNLSEEFDGVCLNKDRVIIPPSLRDRVLKTLHSAHQGVSTMCCRAESSFFWPGMTNAIIKLRNNCSACNRMAPSQPSAPLTPPLQPMYPFECLAADFLHTEANTIWWQ
uniref:uncharacterized protein LOC120327938 n=1 Tax=Styela clava TaxID=7725 RepID=UPI00193A201E|nr:uncharacterized protein LOC120327938 [Styela clava]